MGTIQKMFAVAVCLFTCACAQGATSWSAEKAEYTLGETGNIVVTVDASDFPTGLPSMGITLIMSGVTMELGQMDMATLTSLQGTKIAYQFNLTSETSQVVFTHPYTGVKLFTSGFNVKQGTNGKLQVTNLGASDEYSSTGLRLRMILNGTANGVPQSSGLTKVSEGHYTAPINQNVYIWAIMEDRNGDTTSSTGSKIVLSASYNSQPVEQQFIAFSGDKEGFLWPSKQSGPITLDYCVYCTTDTGIKPLVFQITYQN